MTDDDLLALLDSTLGPVLTPAGFDRAQGDWSQAVFCAPQDAFIAAHPWLPQARPEEWQRGHSTDLTIEFDQTTGLLARVDLEGRSLPSTLYAVGEGALSAELKASYARPLTESLAVVVQALEAVFRPPAEAPDAGTSDVDPIDDYA
ncbi:hypothetical protein [Nocardioides daphniae]|uniref:Uncharacterized protein n=1 Tax=Nocardioides daphniae TaxID=402297 RepID=A0A4P7UDN7_9ACTN|nr:hypothetical protein [Nocardioides daphniae]QCC78370.1 hypothetical protein E2C04_16315 [Nocardioides daphniae]GGD13121.1 hypothetical protein GCM10007231_10170 [Nocardioides daphniae]